MNVNFGNNLYDDDDFPAPPPDLVVKEVINSRKYSGNRPLSGFCITRQTWKYVSAIVVMLALSFFHLDTS